jgi:hypothetical protein
MTGRRGRDAENEGLDFAARLERLTVARDRCVEELERLDARAAALGPTADAGERADLEARRAKARDLLYRLAEAVEEANDKMTALRFQLGHEYAREERRNAAPRWMMAAWVVIVAVVAVILWQWGR